MLQGFPAPPAPPPAPPAFPGEVVVSSGGPTLLEVLPPPVLFMLMIGAMIVTGIVLYPLMRAISRRIERGAATVDPAEVDDLRQRVAELEERQGRIFELEERLDFAERMLADRTREAARLERGDAPA